MRAKLPVLATRTGGSCPTSGEQHPRDFRIGSVIPACPRAGPQRTPVVTKINDDRLTNWPTAATDSGRSSIGARSASKSNASCSTSDGGISGRTLNRSIISLRLGGRIECNQPRIRMGLLEISRLTLGDQTPECRSARRISDQVNARVGGRIEDLVHAPVVEDPRFASRHVDVLVGAEEPDFRAGDYGDVHPNPIEPVMVGVVVYWHRAAAFNAHQARARPDRIERCQHLLQIRARKQRGCRLHRAGDIVILRAADGDQSRSSIAGVFAGMMRPHVARAGLRPRPAADRRQSGPAAGRKVLGASPGLRASCMPHQTASSPSARK